MFRHPKFIHHVHAHGGSSTQLPQLSHMMEAMQKSKKRLTRCRQVKGGGGISWVRGSAKETRLGSFESSMALSLSR